MNKNQFRLLLDATHKRMVNLTASKGEEYSRDADQLANFKRLAAELGLEPEVVWAVYFTKHIDAVKSFVKTRKEFSEPIEGRIDDAILYLILLKGLISDRRNGLIRPTGQPLSFEILSETPHGPKSGNDHGQKEDTRPQFELK